MTSWEDWFEAGEELWTEIEDVDDWAGREAEYMIEQQEFAEEYANNHYDPEDDWGDDDDGCPHESCTQASDGAYYCDRCGRIVADISDEGFAQQMGDNFSARDFQGW